jgi:hypothetical protein
MRAVFDIGAEVRAANRAIGIDDRPAGVRVEAPGVYSMPAEDYHADPCPAPSLSSGIARILISSSPRHAWVAHPRLNPAYEPEDSTTFDLGSAAHALLLEGEDRMAVIDAPDYRTKAAQEARDAARRSGKHPVLRAQYLAVKTMAGIALDAIAVCADLSGLTLDDGDPERVLVWREGDAWCRARPDWIARDLGVQISYKTTATSANPSEFVRQVENLGYDLQDAFYLRGARACGAPNDAITLTLVQENSPPYACAWLALDPVYMAMANGKAARSIELWQYCTKRNSWPGYPPRVHWITPPGYALAKWEEREADMAAAKE